MLTLFFLIIFVVFLVVTGLGVAYLIMLYNGLVSLKHGVSKAWANIDVLLRQRHDELPKLIDTCRQYMNYERSTLERIVKLRSEVAAAQQRQDMVALGQAETALRGSLGQLFALAENYPALRANDSFIHLQQRISALEESIADRHELYNEAVNLNNVRIEQFPDLFLARMFNFKPATLLEFEASQKTDVNINQAFNR